MLGGTSIGSIGCRAAAKLGVERMNREEEIGGRGVAGFEAEVVKLRVALLHRRRDFAVDVDHVETLLDARRHVDRFDGLLLLARCKRQRRQAEPDEKQYGTAQSFTPSHPKTYLSAEPEPLQNP